MPSEVIKEEFKKLFNGLGGQVNTEYRFDVVKILVGWYRDKLDYINPISGGNIFFDIIDQVVSCYQDDKYYLLLISYLIDHNFSTHMNGKKSALSYCTECEVNRHPRHKDWDKIKQRLQ